MVALQATNKVCVNEKSEIIIKRSNEGELTQCTPQWPGAEVRSFEAAFDTLEPRLNNPNPALNVTWHTGTYLPT